MALTAKQEAFVREYLIDLNATQAAIRAGYSAHTAKAIGSENLTKPDVAQAIQEAKASRASATGITAERVLLELSRIAFFDPRTLLNDDGSAKPVNELSDDTAAAIAGLDLQELHTEDGVSGVVKKYKIADKNTALTNALRHLGLLNDKLQLDATVSGTVSYRANIPPRNG